MANEIYHRSNWGNAVNDNAWGDVYQKFDATNEMFIRSDNYENSNETDKIMAAINPKPSILLTPTAYDNGSLHSVKPVKTFGSEIVVNGNYETDSDWSKGTGCTIENGKANLLNAAAFGFALSQTPSFIVGRKYLVEYSILQHTTGSIRVRLGSNLGTTRNGNGTFTETIVAQANSIIFQPTSTFTGSIDNVSAKEVIDADFDFTRGTTATRVNEQGLVADVTDTNLPRIDYTGGTGQILLEPQSTNLFLNSATLSTQGVTTSAASHTVSFYGTGSITLSGTHSATLNGTGANNRVSLTFTPSSGTLTCTVSGSVTNAQIEALSFATSYIPTSGSTVTRNADAANNAGSSDLINSTEGVLYAEIAALSDDATSRVISLSDGTSNERVLISMHTVSNQIRVFIKSGGSFSATITTTLTDIKDFNKIAYKYKSGETKLYINGSLIGTSTNAFSITGLDVLQFANGTPGTGKLFGNVKCVAVYKEALTDAELTALTT